MFLKTASELKIKPTKIVTLVPSQTELLYDLGLLHEVVGITKFCVHPVQWRNDKTIIGGTKNINLQKIHHLQPNLIIANKEENIKAQVDELAKHYPVWVTDVFDLKSALQMITDVGIVTHTKKQSKNLVTEIENNFKRLKQTISLQQYLPKKVAYLIWKNPYMTVGGDTFISDLLVKCNFTNVFKNHSRYPQISINDLQSASIEILFLSSEPYPFSVKHINQLQTLLPHTKIVLVNGEMFSWYGSRLLKTVTYFEALLRELYQKK
jgi:ABC-type Fe3+-hydroxamate transport system substrate-binding protein